MKNKHLLILALLVVTLGLLLYFNFKKPYTETEEEKETFTFSGDEGKDDPVFRDNVVVPSDEAEIYYIRAQALFNELVRRTNFTKNDRTMFPSCYYDAFHEGFGGGFRQGELIGQSFSFPKRITFLCNEYYKHRSSNEALKRIKSIKEDEVMVKMEEMLRGFETDGLGVKILSESSMLHEETAALLFYIQDNLNSKNKLSNGELVAIYDQAHELHEKSLNLGVNTSVIKDWQRESVKSCFEHVKSLIN